MAFGKRLLGLAGGGAIAAALTVALVAGPAQAGPRNDFVGEFRDDLSTVAIAPGETGWAPLAWQSAEGYGGNRDIALILEAPDHSKFASTDIRVSLSNDGGRTFAPSLPLVECKFGSGSNKGLLGCSGEPSDYWTWTPGQVIKFEFQITVDADAPQDDTSETTLTGGSVQGKFQAYAPSKQVVYLDGTGNFGVTVPPKFPVPTVDPTVAGVTAGAMLLVGAGVFVAVRRRKAAAQAA